MVAIDNDRKALFSEDESSATHPSVFPPSPQEYLIEFEECSMQYQKILSGIRIPNRKTKGMKNLYDEYELWSGCNTNNSKNLDEEKLLSFLCFVINLRREYSQPITFRPEWIARSRNALTCGYFMPNSCTSRSIQVSEPRLSVRSNEQAMWI